LKKTIKQEDSLVRQIVYTGLSAYTNDPINLGIIAPTSEGKTYPVIESIKVFPKEDVWLIGNMSTKMLVRQKGVLVDQNNEPLKPKIKELKKEIENAKKNDKDKNVQEDLKEQLEALSENARNLIELTGKILIFLEPPEHELWNLLKPILSHDSEEIDFPFVDKTERGFVSRRVIVKGWPACIFCSVRDESNWPAWPEIVSRALITSPNMNPEKYRESNLLIAQRKGLPRLIQQQMIVSDEEIGLAKLCISHIKEQIQRYSSKDPVWIPFFGILAEALPAAKGPDNRITKRIFSFLQIIVLAKSHLRKKLILGSETQIIAALEDLSQVLYITQNISGMPSYKLKYFKDYFVPLVESKKKPDEKAELKENIIGVTSKELCEYYKGQTGKSITADAMKKTYLNELLNNGYIDEEDSIIDKRQKIYHHIVDIPTSDPEKTSNYTNSTQFDNSMQHSKLILSKNFTNIPENWLKLEILDLIKYRIDPPRFLILDENNNELCICKFVEEYEKHATLIRYFSKPKFKEYHSELFGTMKYFKQFSTEEYEKLSNHDKFVQLDNSDVQSTSKSPETKTNSMQNDNTGASSNADTVSDHPYWTKGKWRENL
jgi:hypothetical protein